MLEFLQGTGQLILVHRQLLPFNRQLFNDDRQVLTKGSSWIVTAALVGSGSLGLPQADQN